MAEEPSPKEAVEGAASSLGGEGAAGKDKAERAPAKKKRAARPTSNKDGKAAANAPTRGAVPSKASYDFVGDRLREGHPRADVEDALVATKGFRREDAAALVRQIAGLQKEVRVSAKKEARANEDAARRNMFAGVLSFGVGVAVTIASYSAASSGGIYIVASGAIFYGIFSFLRGLLQMRGS